MTDLFTSDGAKAPSHKPFTVEEGRAVGKAVFEEFQRVATRWSNPPVGCDSRLRGDD